MSCRLFLIPAFVAIVIGVILIQITAENKTPYIVGIFLSVLGLVLILLAIICYARRPNLSLGEEWKDREIA